MRAVWVDSTFRLETAAKKLELRPTLSGVVAVSLVDGKEQESTPVDLSSDPFKLAKKWLEEEGDAVRQ